MNPHAMRALWPMITPGTPENPKPATSKPQSEVMTRHFRPIWCHTLGSAAPRCGSFASRGSPVSVRSPETTHEFEPIPSPAPPSRALAASITPSTSCHWTDAVAAVSSPCAGVLAGVTAVRVGTITGLRSKG